MILVSAPSGSIYAHVVLVRGYHFNVFNLDSSLDSYLPCTAMAHFQQVVVIGYTNKVGPSRWSCCYRVFPEPEKDLVENRASVMLILHGLGDGSRACCTNSDCVAASTPCIYDPRG
jgi:hypothetical protein